ncbi:hypothetical protein EV360DRAFT_90025 [Lentinula raphanica]|nr:hypothetical protein EV360DRAFT_90025 [Lentinula raphanica]
MTSLPTAAALSLPGVVFSTVYFDLFFRHSLSLPSLSQELLADDESRQHVSSVVATVLPVSPAFASNNIACREEMWGDLRNRGFNCTGSGWEILGYGRPHAMREEKREGDEGAGSDFSPSLPSFIPFVKLSNVDEAMPVFGGLEEYMDIRRYVQPSNVHNDAFMNYLFLVSSFSLD